MILLPTFLKCWIEEGCDSLSSSSDELLGGYTPESEIEPQPSQPTHTLYMAMEFCPWILEGKMNEEGGLDRERIRKYFRQLLEGLAHLHSRGIVHADLSRKNILVDCDDDIKITDLGLAFTLEGSEDYIRESSTLQGNPLYRAPEMNETPPRQDMRSDIFSLGLILYEMLYPMRTDSERFDIFGKIRGVGLSEDSVGRKVYDYLIRLVAIEPFHRFSAADLLHVRVPF